MQRAASPLATVRNVPTIAAYELPGEAMLEYNRVSWTPEPRRCALLLHDVQNYWMERFQDPESVIRNCASLLHRARALSMPVFYSMARREDRLEDRGLALDLWGAGLGGDSFEPRDAEIIDALRPADGEMLLEKRKYSAFFETDFHDQLRSKGIDQLIVAGVYAHHGCLLSAADAYMRDIAPFFVVDATADHSEEQHLATCRLVPDLCGQNATTRSLLAALEG